MNQWFLLVKLNTSLRRFNGRHHNLVDHNITIWNLIISDSDQSGVVTVKTNYIYIGIGIVAGFGLLIVILILTVIHLATTPDWSESEIIRYQMVWVRVMLLNVTFNNIQIISW
jgi:hypothetical protein